MSHVEIAVALEFDGARGGAEVGWNGQPAVGPRITREPSASVIESRCPVRVEYVVPPGVGVATVSAVAALRRRNRRRGARSRTARQTPARARPLPRSSVRRGAPRSLVPSAREPEPGRPRRRRRPARHRSTAQCSTRLCRTGAPRASADRSRLLGRAFAGEKTRDRIPVGMRSGVVIELSRRRSYPIDTRRNEYPYSDHETLPEYTGTPVEGDRRTPGTRTDSSLFTTWMNARFSTA